MEMTVTIKEGNVIIGGVNLDELLDRVYQRGKHDAIKEDKGEMITFQQLSKELEIRGRKISVQTLTKKAREANIPVLPFDGKRLSVSRKMIKHFLSNY